jgi:hypothetical protein
VAKDDKMPAELRGYVLTQTLKSGARLCTAYNVDACAQDPQNHEVHHLCSVMLQSGRACGGCHPAKDCKGKRTLTEPGFRRCSLDQCPPPPRQQQKPDRMRSLERHQQKMKK